MDLREGPISHTSVKKEGVASTISTPNNTEVFSTDVDDNHFLSALMGEGGSDESIVHDLAVDLSPENVIRRIGERASEILAIERCSVFFVDSETSELVVYRNTSTGKSDSVPLPFSDGTNELRLPIGTGLAGHVATTGETLIVDDVTDDARFSGTMDDKTGFRTRNMLVCPLRDPLWASSRATSRKNSLCDAEPGIGIGIAERNRESSVVGTGKVIGVLQAINKREEDGPFNEQDRSLLETFSAHAAIALANAKLYATTQQSLKESRAMVKISEGLSSELEFQKLMHIIAVEITSVLQAERCTCFIVDGDHLYSTSMLSFGVGIELPIQHKKEDVFRFPKDKGLAGHAYTTKKLLHVTDAYKDQRFNQEIDKRTGFRTRNMLVMPIISRNKTNDCIGVVQVINKKDGRQFSRADIRMVKAFAPQISIAVSNSKLFEETEKALNHAILEVRNLKFMLSITRSLFSEDQTALMLQKMIAQIQLVLKAHHASIFLNYPKSKEIVNVNKPKVRIPYATGIAGEVARTGKNIAISKDATKHAKFDKSVDQEYEHPLSSLLCVPILAERHADSDEDEDDDDDILDLEIGDDMKEKSHANGNDTGRSKNEIVGVCLVCDEVEQGGFQKEEEAMLMCFCRQIGVAIEASQRVSRVMQTEGIRPADTSAAEYLIAERGMKLATDTIVAFQFKMDDLTLANRIGSGSYGEVFKAQLKGETVAVKRLFTKRLKAEHLESFCSEASLMIQLQHENIVKFLGAVADPTNFCIITECCEKGSLTDLLLDHTVEITESQKLRCMLDAAYGLRYLHMCNPKILHRDLKSDNFLITHDWRTKVADFGLTRFRDEKRNMTQVGTPMWMAPEVILGEKYTEKADVYSYGIIMWEILTRGEPYEDKEMMQIVVEVVNEDLRPKISRDLILHPLVPLMKECWSKDPAERPDFNKICERLEKELRRNGW